MLEKRVAIYLRLSYADEETGRTKDESNSVNNQRGLSMVLFTVLDQ